jgi:hypothetical protein
MPTGWTAGVRFLARERDLSELHSVQTGFGAHPSSYPVGTGGPISGDKVTGMKLTTHYHLVRMSRVVELMEPRSRSGRRGEEKNLTLPRIESWPSNSQLIVIPTELSRL